MRSSSRAAVPKLRQGIVEVGLTRLVPGAAASNNQEAYTDSPPRVEDSGIECGVMRPTMMFQFPMRADG